MPPASMWTQQTQNGSLEELKHSMRQSAASHLKESKTSNMSRLQNSTHSCHQPNSGVSSPQNPHPLENHSSSGETHDLERHRRTQRPRTPQTLHRRLHDRAADSSSSRLLKNLRRNRNETSRIKTCTSAPEREHITHFCNSHINEHQNNNLRNDLPKIPHLLP